MFSILNLILDIFLTNFFLNCLSSMYECKEPTVYISLECAGRHKCNVLFTELKIQGCVTKYANGLEFDYQCIPELPIQNTKSYSCDSNRIISDVQNGFITSPKYPNYILSQNWEVDIIPPVNFGYKFYIIDVGLSPELEIKKAL